MLEASTRSASAGMSGGFEVVLSNIAAMRVPVTSTDVLWSTFSDWLASSKEITVPFSSSVEPAMVKIRFLWRRDCTMGRACRGAVMSRWQHFMCGAAPHRWSLALLTLAKSANCRIFLREEGVTGVFVRGS